MTGAGGCWKGSCGYWYANEEFQIGKYENFAEKLETRGFLSTLC